MLKPRLLPNLSLELPDRPIWQRLEKARKQCTLGLKILECSLPVLQQLEIEEALLRAGEGNWCILNHGSPPAIVLGLSSSIENLVDREKVQKNPIPLIRRFSGGGTVVVDENTLFFTLILEKKTFPSALMEWSGELLSPVFLPHTLTLEGHDYALHGKKVGGNAQSFAKERALHHTSFLWSWEKERMAYLKLPPHQPLYRKSRSHDEFCGSLSSFFPSKEAFFGKLKEALSLQFSLSKASLSDAILYLSMPHLKRLRVET